MEMAFFVIINELLRDKVIAIWNSIIIVLIVHFIRTSTTDTNSNSSLADNLNCVLWWSRYPEITMW